MAKRETDDEKRDRFLRHVEMGREEFQANSGRPPTPAGKPTSEVYTFKEPSPARLSLRKRGWTDATHLYDPQTLAATKTLADDLGIYFAELQDLALGLILDQSKRSMETQEMLDRVKSRFR